MSTETLTSLGLRASDIKYNLDILAGKTAYPLRGIIQPQNINQISLEFIEIFASQIRELEQKNSDNPTLITQELNDHLAAAAGRIHNCLKRGSLSDEFEEEASQDVSDSRYFSWGLGGRVYEIVARCFDWGWNCFQDVPVPPVGEAPISPLQLIFSGTPDRIKAGLTKLEGHHTVLKIKGDGHCLFRAVATGLLLHYESAARSERDILIQHFETLKTQFPQIAEDLNKMIHILSESQSMLATMQTLETSNAMVQVLRRLACEYNKTLRGDVQDVLRSMIEAESGSSSFEEYFRDMSDMKKAKYGGEPELTALSKALGAKIRVVDVARQNQPEIRYTEYNPAEAPMSSLGTNGINLLFRVDHYDYLAT